MMSEKNEQGVKLIPYLGGAGEEMYGKEEKGHL